MTPSVEHLLVVFLGAAILGVLLSMRMWVRKKNADRLRQLKIAATLMRQHNNYMSQALADESVPAKFRALLIEFSDKMMERSNITEVARVLASRDWLRDNDEDAEFRQEFEQLSLTHPEFHDAFVNAIMSVVLSSIFRWANLIAVDDLVEITASTAVDRRAGERILEKVVSRWPSWHPAGEPVAA